MHSGNAQIFYCHLVLLPGPIFWYAHYSLNNCIERRLFSRDTHTIEGDD